MPVHRPKRRSAAFCRTTTTCSSPLFGQASIANPTVPVVNVIAIPSLIGSLLRESRAVGLHSAAKPHYRLVLTLSLAKPTPLTAATMLPRQSPNAFLSRFSTHCVSPTARHSLLTRNPLLDHSHSLLLLQTHNNPTHNFSRQQSSRTHCPLRLISCSLRPMRPSTRAAYFCPFPLVSKGPLHLPAAELGIRVTVMSDRVRSLDYARTAYTALPLYLIT